MKRALASALVPFFSSALFACTADDSTHAPPPRDASTIDSTIETPDGAASFDSGDGADEDASCSVEPNEAAASCADLALPTSSVTYANSTGALPIANGGTIAPGLYSLVSQTTYAPAPADASAPQRTSALAFDACGHFTFTSFTTTTATIASTVAGTWAASGATLHLVEDCPSVEALTPLLFTATPTQLTLIEPADPISGAPAGVSVYTKP